MSIRKKNIEELELMSYTDIAYEIIKEDKKKKYNTPNLFKTTFIFCTNSSIV